MRYFLFVIFVAFTFSQNIKAQPQTDFEISRNLDIYSSVFQQLYLHYAEEMQVGELNKKAIDAMLLALDPYTNFYPEAEIEDVKYLKTGRYGGVGASIHIQNDTIVVGSVLKNYPFYKAGIFAGDRLLSADGQSLIGKTADQMSEILKGAAGSQIKLEVKKLKTGQKETKIVEREEIKINNVPYFGMLEKGLGYVKLSQFNETAASEIDQAITKMQSTEKLEGLVLDLRDNGGGLLQQAVEIMDLFLPPGLLVVETKGKMKEENHRYLTYRPAKYPDMPVVVLINERSASASEIVAGAFQDYDRGVILGKKSFGKGLVQKVFPLSYNAQMKVTVAKYYIPSGRCIQELNYGDKKDGKATKTADSLRGTFKTQNGRIVYDAGGILPDIETKFTDFEPIVIDLAVKRMIFNFALNYVHNHDSIHSQESFDLTDDDYEDFKKFLDSKEYRYESLNLKMMNKILEDSAVNSNESLAKQAESLKKLLIENDLVHLDKNKEIILQLIEQDIISYYYSDAGRAKRILKSDISTKEAVELLTDNQRYKNLLSKIMQ
ncbi:MAG: S41 family peptidase [Bacteroidales bacterium]|nr:S41 family peptidase [Bacteroidales bacterium]